MPRQTAILLVTVSGLGSLQQWSPKWGAQGIPLGVWEENIFLYLK